MFPSPFARRFGIKSAPFVTNDTVTNRGKLSKDGTVIRKLSIAPQGYATLSLPIAAQFLRCRRVLLWLQRCDFWAVESLFSLTTAAQNIHVFPRKSPLFKKHFFERAKVAVLLIDCGTSTLKSLLPLGSDAPHVHPRPRKRLPRCTLDRGFKAPESPALRGFEAERCPITGTSLYLCFYRTAFTTQKTFL